MEEKYSRKEIKKINSETMDRQKGNRQPWTDFWGKTLCFPAWSARYATYGRYSVSVKHLPAQFSPLIFAYLDNIRLPQSQSL